MKKIDVLYFNGEILIEMRGVEDDLKTYHELIDCDIIDIVSLKIGDEYYDFIVDDEGFFKKDYFYSVFINKQPALVGKFIITKSNKIGETISLTEEDIENIYKNIQYIQYLLKVEEDVELKTAIEIIN